MIAEKIMEMNDYLHQNGVFYNNLGGETRLAHMDSYMTCINFQKLEECWNYLKNNYTFEEWQKMIQEWKDNAYCSPNCGILAHMFKFWLDKITADETCANAI